MHAHSSHTRIILLLALLHQLGVFPYFPSENRVPNFKSEFRSGTTGSGTTRWGWWGRFFIRIIIIIITNTVFTIIIIIHVNRLLIFICGVGTQTRIVRDIGRTAMGTGPQFGTLNIIIGNVLLSARIMAQNSP